MHEGLGKKSKWLWEAAKHLQKYTSVRGGVI
jgi:hypothetical protein